MTREQHGGTAILILYTYNGSGETTGQRQPSSLKYLHNLNHLADGRRTAHLIETKKNPFWHTENLKCYKKKKKFLHSNFFINQEIA